VPASGRKRREVGMGDKKGKAKNPCLLCRAAHVREQYERTGKVTELSMFRSLVAKFEEKMAAEGEYGYYLDTMRCEHRDEVRAVGDYRIMSSQVDVGERQRREAVEVLAGSSRE
jgi:hypothetical protein